ncbi:MAG: hypothetical protein ACPGVX_05905, partial [Thalassobaculaceae bacterium]
KLFLKYVSIYGWRRDSREEVERRFNVTAREGYGMTEIGGGTIEAHQKNLSKDLARQRAS